MQLCALAHGKHTYRNRRSVREKVLLQHQNTFTVRNSFRFQYPGASVGSPVIIDCTDPSTSGKDSSDSISLVQQTETPSNFMFSPTMNFMQTLKESQPDTTMDTTVTSVGTDNEHSIPQQLKTYELNKKRSASQKRITNPDCLSDSSNSSCRDISLRSSTSIKSAEADSTSSSSSKKTRKNPTESAIKSSELSDDNFLLGNVRHSGTSPFCITPVIKSPNAVDSPTVHFSSPCPTDAFRNLDSEQIPDYFCPTSSNPSSTTSLTTSVRLPGEHTVHSNVSEGPVNKNSDRSPRRSQRLQTDSERLQMYHSIQTNLKTYSKQTDMEHRSKHPESVAQPNSGGQLLTTNIEDKGNGKKTRNGKDLQRRRQQSARSHTNTCSHQRNVKRTQRFKGKGSNSVRLSVSPPLQTIDKKKMGRLADTEGPVVKKEIQQPVTSRMHSKLRHSRFPESSPSSSSGECSQRQVSGNSRRPVKRTCRRSKRGVKKLCPSSIFMGNYDYIPNLRSPTVLLENMSFLVEKREPSEGNDVRTQHRQTQLPYSEPSQNTSVAERSLELRVYDTTSNSPDMLGVPGPSNWKPTLTRKSNEKSLKRKKVSYTSDVKRLECFGIHTSPSRKSTRITFKPLTTSESDSPSSNESNCSFPYSNLTNQHFAKTFSGVSAVPILPTLTKRSLSIISTNRVPAAKKFQHKSVQVARNDIGKCSGKNETPTRNADSQTEVEFFLPITAAFDYSIPIKTYGKSHKVERSVTGSPSSDQPIATGQISTHDKIPESTSQQAQPIIVDLESKTDRDYVRNVSESSDSSNSDQSGKIMNKSTLATEHDEGIPPPMTKEILQKESVAAPNTSSRVIPGPSTVQSVQVDDQLPSELHGQKQPVDEKLTKEISNEQNQGDAIESKMKEIYALPVTTRSRSSPSLIQEESHRNSDSSESASEASKINGNGKSPQTEKEYEAKESDRPSVNKPRITRSKLAKTYGGSTSSGDMSSSDMDSKDSLPKSKEKGKSSNEGNL